MNGIHDMGGMHGLGKVEVERDEPVFHSEWEKSVFVMMMSTLSRGLYNLDEFRHSIERMRPVNYLASRYYEHWLHSIEDNLISKGIITKEELEERIKQVDSGQSTTKKKDDPELTESLLSLVRNGGSTSREVPQPPKFKAGDPVVARNINPIGHTRLPRYVRGKKGVVEKVHNAFVLPDSNAHLNGESPEYVYSIRFEGSDVWGDTCESNETLHVDLWESYLSGGE